MKQMNEWWQWQLMYEVWPAGSKPVHIGYFDSQQDAARAYDQEAIRLRGPNTSLNYPITDYDVSAAPLAADLHVLARHES